MHKTALGLLVLAAGSLSAAPAGAQNAAATPTPSAGTAAAATTPSAACLEHIRSFNAQLEKDGHWLGGSGYGYGYPASGYWLDGGGIFTPTYEMGARVNAKSGYDVRTLLAAARILAMNGKQQPCEEALSAAGDVYKTYVSDLKSRNVPAVDTSGWREQLAAAKPVSEQPLPIRSDELLGTELRNGKNEPLGSVDDLILDPGTGRIAYLVIARGGLFGIGGDYVPVPWSDFKVTPKLDLLVLDATRQAMEEAPRVDYSFFSPEAASAPDKKADLYWKTHLSQNGD